MNRNTELAAMGIVEIPNYKEKFHPTTLEELKARFDNNGFVPGYKEIKNPKGMEQAQANFDNLMDSMKYKYRENSDFSFIEYCFLLCLEEQFNEVALEIWESGVIKDIENYVGHFNFNDELKRKFLKHPRIIAKSYGTKWFDIYKENGWFGDLDVNELRAILESYPDLTLIIPNKSPFDWKKDNSIRL